VVSAGIDLEQLSLDNPEPAVCDELNLVFVGRLFYSKGITCTLQTLNVLVNCMGQKTAILHVFCASVRFFPYSRAARSEALAKCAEEEATNMVTPIDKPRGLKRRRLLLISLLFGDLSLDREARMEILQHLAKRGYDTTLISARSKTLQAEDSRVHSKTVPLRCVPVFSAFAFGIILLLILPFYIILSKIDYLIVESNVPFFGLVSSLPFSKLKMTRIFLDVRSPPVEVGNLQGVLQRFFFASSVIVARRFFDGITFITDGMKEELCKRFGIDSALAGVWSTGVSIDLFNPENHFVKGNDLKIRLGLSDKFVVLYQGVFSPNRGLREAIEAISIIKHAHPNVILFLLGTGRSVADLKRLVHENGVEDNVIIHEPVSHLDVPAYISMSDVCLITLPDHPYWRYQCPLKLLEYLAMGKAVIVSDIPAHRSIIGWEKCGIYVPSIDQHGIAESILFAYDNKERLQDWGKCGKKIVHDGHSWDEAAENLESYILSVTDKSE
jgi:glycosyltransferase involved in cell wall biosynthesis